MRNNCVDKKGRIKFGGYKGGRGYSGWHTTFDGKIVYLRSTLEYMVAKKLDYHKIYYLTEKKIYIVNDIKYKPDFFIYSDETYSNLIKIIEIKYTKLEADNYYLLYKHYFNDMGVEYEVEGYDLNKNRNYYFITKSEIQEWKERYVLMYNNFDYNGEKNPMYGNTHSDITKQKIGNATRKYMSNPEIKEKHSQNIKNFWKSDEAIELKNKYRKLRKQEYDNRQKEQNILNPIINKVCQICGNTFEIRKNSNRTVCVNNKCIHIYNVKYGLIDRSKMDGKLNYKRKIIAQLIKITENITENNLDDILFKYKNNGIFSKNFGISIDTIRKYFGTFENLKEEIHRGKIDKNNKKT